MKYLLLVILSLLLASQRQLPPGYFYVTGIRGELVNKRTGLALSLGDKVLSTDTLTATTPDYYLSLINSYGEYAISPSNPGDRDKASPSEFVMTLSADLKKLEMRNLASRRLDLPLSAANLSKLFHPGDSLCRDRILLLDKDRIAFDRAGYPQGEGDFFSIIAVPDNGAGPSRLQTVRDSLELSRADLGTAPLYYLYYNYTANGEPHEKRLIDFKVSFLSAAEAESIIDNFLGHYPKTPDTSLYDLENALFGLFARVYRAAPRGAHFDNLINRKVARFLSKAP
jgi:hypothetical protein